MVLVTASEAVRCVNYRVDGSCNFNGILTCNNIRTKFPKNCHFCDRRVLEGR